MCGICGIVDFDPIGHNDSSRLIEHMTNMLIHRGPNDCGAWQARGIALGSRRLSVIDLSEAGRMPMSNEDGAIQIVYNGEIYNYRELRERFALDRKGHIFRSKTDTEVLVHLYEELGLNMMRELNGMFAIAIWDSNQQLLHLIRDSYGIKPLFYQQDQHCLRFGSEIKAILADRRVMRNPSRQAMHDFLTFNYIPGSQTAFDGIYEVPPGHWMTVNRQGVQTSVRYCDIHMNANQQIDERTAIYEAKQLMNQAVQRQLVADVPIGVLLSGGMDSSTIVALMNQHVPDAIRTYSIGFEEQSFNELSYAHIVAKHFKTIHREIIVTPHMVMDLLPKYLSYIDEPYGDGSAIPTYYVCQLAKNDVTVVLSGEGGDEAFAGYDTYSAYLAAQWFRRIPRWVREEVIAPFVNRLPVSEKKLSAEFKLKRFLGGQDLSPAHAHLWWRIVLTEKQKFALYTPDITGEVALAPSVRFFVEAYQRQTTPDALARLMYIDSVVFLPDDLMIKNDRMSMAHSIEARVPMTDLELTRFMAQVPTEIKMRHRGKKHIMRHAMKDMLPATILNRKKIGLEMPYSRWLKNELKELLFVYLEPCRLRDAGIFQPQAIKMLIDEHLSGRHDHGRALWGLLNYMMWLELYIN